MNQRQRCHSGAFIRERFFAVFVCMTMVAGAHAADQQVAPASASVDVFSDDAWQIADIRGNTFESGTLEDRSVITASGRQLVITSKDTHGPNSRFTTRFRIADGDGRASLTFAAGLKDPLNLREAGYHATVSASKGAAAWNVFDPVAGDRRSLVRGTYRPQFSVERSLTWPESLRRNVESDMATSAPIEERWLTLTVTLRSDGYEVSLNGVPLTRVTAEMDVTGSMRVTVSPNVAVSRIKVESVPPADTSWTYKPVSIDSLLNASSIDGKQIARESFPADRRIEVGGVPFELSEPDDKGNDHVDIGASWFRQGNLDGRFSGRGSDSMNGRWLGVMAADPSRLALRIAMARYSAIHVIAAADSEADAVPVITAQFYRPSSGFPHNFEARVPLFSAKASAVNAIKVKTTDGTEANLYHVTIPINPGDLLEFDDLDNVEVELTKQVKLYRASPDPMYYSFHAAGLPSSVHVYAVTTERPALDVELTADSYAHIWTAPATPKYTVTVRNRTGPARDVSVMLETTSLDGSATTTVTKTVKVSDDKYASFDLPLSLKQYGLHEVKLTVKDGDQTWIEPRSLAYLHEDTRDRGDWDFGRGPLFGFWNWGGGHVTPAAEKQLAAMIPGGIEAIPGSYEQGIARWGDATDKIIKDNGIFTMKFAGAGDHYITARFAGNLKKDGLESARKTFLEDLDKARSQAGPNSRPTFISFFPEPSIGPVTHGIFPEYIN